MEFSKYLMYNSISFGLYIVEISNATCIFRKNKERIRYLYFVLVKCVEDGLSTRGCSLLQSKSQFSAQMHWDQVLGAFLFAL